MKKAHLSSVLYCILLSVVQAVSVQGQTPAMEKDETRPTLFALDEKVKDHLYSNTDSAFYFARKGLELAQEKGDLPYQVTGFKNLSKIHGIRQRNFDSAQHYFEKGMQLLNSKDADQLLQEERGVLKHNMAIVRFVEANFDSAIVLADQALEHFKLQDVLPHEEHCMTYNTLGISYGRKGVRKSALESFMAAAQCLESLDKTDSRLGSIYNNVGNLLQEDGKYQQAIGYFQRAIPLYKRDLQLGMAHSNLGLCYENLGQGEKVIEHYQKALGHYQKAGNEAKLASIYFNIGSFYLNQNDYANALRYYEDALTIERKLGTSYELESTLRGMALVHLRLGKLNQAEAFAQEALQLIKENDYRDVLPEALELWAEIMEAQGKYRQATATYRQLLDLNDSLNQAKYETELSALQTQFEVDRKDTEIASLKTQEALQRQALQAEKEKNYYFMGGIAISVIALIVFAIFYQKLKAARAQLEEANRTKDKFFSIVAHDLRNPVVAFHGLADIINHHIRKERWERLQALTEKIDTEAKQLYQLLDNLLNWASSQTGTMPYKPEKVSVKELIEENLNLYESAAQAKNIALTSDLSEALEVFADRNGASTILRNLVGNAIKFTPEGGQIRVSAKKEGNHVILTTTDNGVGMDEQKVRTLFQLSGERSKRGTQGEKGTGLGLILAKEFALLNKGKIWAESQVSQGTTFFVQLPVG